MVSFAWTTKKGYPICTDCTGRGLDVVTHGQAVKTGAAANKAKGKQRASQHKGKKAAAAKAASKRRRESSSEEEEEDESEGEEEEEEEGEEEDGAEAEAAQWGSAAGQMEEGIWMVERLIATWCGATSGAENKGKSEVVLVGSLKHAAHALPVAMLAVLAIPSPRTAHTHRTCCK